MIAALRAAGERRAALSVERIAARLFGSLDAAREAAGLPALPHLPGRPRTKADTQATQRARERSAAHHATRAARETAERELGLAGLREAMTKLGRVPLPSELSAEVWLAIRMHCRGFRKAVAFIERERAETMPADRVVVEPDSADPEARP